MHSTTLIYFLILFAALCHAGWSSILKSKNSLGIMSITSIVEIIIFTPLVFYVPFPTKELWFYIIVSVILHGFYRLSVLYSYKLGDLSFVYPIARGSSSLLIATTTILLLNSQITLIGFISILIVSFGIYLISYNKKYKFNRNAFVLASITALLITIYTIIDGVGVRLSSNKFSYIFWMLLLNGIPVLILGIIKKEEAFSKINKSFIIYGLLAGILAILSYGIVVWSMQFLQIAYVSSIRETSIIIATLIGYYFLGESKAKTRIVPSIFVIVGITLLYFQI
tara:strand:+ start:2800 stop:3642 length:843 start_codon:yes stop_codon:yes gene_type:complete